MFALLGLILVLLGILGLVDLIGIATAWCLVLLVVGVVLIAYDRGLLTRR
jgi:hypothetical protein